jgi:hypothetical protein
MMKKGWFRLLVGAGVAAVLSASSAQASDVCDRACLEGMVNKFIAAMVSHNPEALPLQRDFKYTEDGQQLWLGDGLFGTASAPGKYKLYVSDPEDGQAGFIGTLFENGVPIYIALRLKVEYGLISEAEVIAARGSGNAALPSAGKTLEEKGKPRPEFLRTVPANERMSRADLIKVANSYFTGLGGDTGHNTAPFAKTCLRWENGTQTNSNTSFPDTSGLGIVGMSCEDQQKSGWFAFVTEIRNRRFPIVDRERGLVMSFAFFDHNARPEPIHMTNGKTTMPPLKAPTTLEISELFQIDKGLINQVEAVINTVPYRMKSALWDK